MLLLQRSGVLGVLVLAALAFAQDATPCTSNTDCPEGFFCECSESLTSASDSTQFLCRAKSGLGEFCGGFRRCADYCADGLVCQAQQQSDIGPSIADLPGKCCKPVEVACEEGMLPTYDEMGCLDGGCRKRVCNGLAPLADEIGTPLFCGRGPAHVDCPSGSSCSIAPDDSYAVCCPDTPATKEPSSETPIRPGGIAHVDVNSDDVRIAADCAMAQINRLSNSLYASVVTKIISGTQQVVAGMKYILTVEVAESSACKNDNTVKTINECPVDGTPRTLQLEILVQPWMETSCTLVTFSEVKEAPNCPEVMCMMFCENGFKKDPNTGCDMCQCNEEPSTTSTTSQPAEVKTCPPVCAMYCEYGNVKDENGCDICKCNPAPVVGGASVIPDLKNDLVLRAAQCALDSINRQSNALFRQVLSRVDSGTQQVVTGIRYKMRIQVGESSACRNDGSAKTLAECPISGALKMYDVDVVVVPWMSDSCTMNSFAEVKEAPNCPEVMCKMFCENGFKKDPNTGCDMCQCNEPATVESSTAKPSTATVPASSSAKPTCSPVMCMMYCEYGNVKDANGCPICKCNTAPTTAGPSTTPPKVVGGASPIAVGDAMVTEAANCAVLTISKAAESDNAMVLMEVISGTQQVVSGIKYKLRIRVGQSSACANDGVTHTLAECPVATTDFRGEYDVTVVLQPWLSSGSCASADHTLVASDGTIVSSGSKGNKSSSSSDVMPFVVGMCGGAIVVLVIAAIVITRSKSLRHRYEVAATTPTPTGYENPAYASSTSSSVLDLDLSD